MEEINAESVKEALKKIFTTVDERTEQERVDDFWKRTYQQAVDKGTFPQLREVLLGMSPEDFHKSFIRIFKKEV